MHIEGYDIHQHNLQYQGHLVQPQHTYKLFFIEVIEYKQRLNLLLQCIFSPLEI